MDLPVPNGLPSAARTSARVDSPTRRAVSSRSVFGRSPMRIRMSPQPKAMGDKSSMTRHPSVSNREHPRREPPSRAALRRASASNIAMANILLALPRQIVLPMTPVGHQAWHGISLCSFEQGGGGEPEMPLISILVQKHQEHLEPNPLTLGLGVFVRPNGARGRINREMRCP